MSKSEGRRFFQPIPLSAILDPTYQSPFSKLKQFQVDVDISSKMCHHYQQQPRPSVWRKLQTTLMSAMSSLVVISQPTFSSSMISRSTTSMALVPWKSYKSCDLLSSESEAAFSPTSQENKSPATPETPSLYYSIRSGLECLRYFATHPLTYEEGRKKVTSPVRENPELEHCKQSNILLQPVGHTFVGGALYFPLVSDSSLTALSAPPTPSHHRSQTQFLIPNLFSLAMSGFLIASPQYQDPISAFYNSCFFSPIHMKGKRSMSMPSSPHKSSALDIPDSPNIEILLRSASPSQDQFMPKLDKTAQGSGTPTKELPISKSSAAAGCFMIETSWRSKSNSGSGPEDSFHAVSVCSSSSTLKCGALTFSCSSSLSSSPKAMASTCGLRRYKTESESSTDSFIEFSASVESTDSFAIVFEPAGGCIDEEAVGGDYDEDDDDEWEDDDSDEDNTDEEEDQIFNYSSSTTDDLYMDGVFFQGNGDDGTDQADFCFKPELVKKKLKTVSFNEEQLEHVIEFDDDTDSKSARETYWEMLARDRARFQDRIFRTGDILDPIFDPNHRQKVFQERFSSVSN